MCNAENQQSDVRTPLNEDQRLAYDKAIEGYQFQVGRYNTWMNYYAIFVGALFVALYNIWPSAAGDCACCKGCHSGQPLSDCSVWFLPIVISILGLLASICWYGALLGYHTWNSHWMGVVHKIEGLVFAASNENMAENKKLKVYGDMPETKWNTPYAEEFISTQKITGIFIFCIMLAWIAVIAFGIYNTLGISVCNSFLVFFIGAMFAIVLLIVLHNCVCDAYSSKIRK